MPLRHLALLLGSAALVFALATTPSPAADELTEISALLRQGNQAKALERVEAFLAGNPRDTRARFLKGVILTDLGKNTEAIRMFSTLIKDFPELPEPYNNLAVLYALEGDYARARSTLETAIRKNPGYAIAYENLGDLHAKIASQAYEKARQLDKANTGAQAKSDTIRGMLKGVPGAARSGESAAKSGAAKVAAADPATTGKPEPVPATVQQPVAKSVETSRLAAVPPAAVPASPASSKSAAEAPRPAGVPAGTKAAAPDAAGEVIAALNRWAGAWSSKDATAYLASYAPDFRVPDNESRAQWEALRRVRIAKPRTIEVNVSTPTVGIRAPDRAIVSFRQRYRSDTADEADNKLMVFAKQGGKWLILEERVVK